MKRILFFAFILMIANGVYAQNQSDELPVYKRFPELPKFTIMKSPDSTVFTRDNLPKKKATIIMLFSPDCGHCTQTMKQMLENYDMWKSAELVMVSFLDYSHIQKFYDEFHIANYPNIVVGRDGSYYLGTYFANRQYPSFFVYDKKQNFVTEFRGNLDLKQLAEAL